MRRPVLIVKQRSQSTAGEAAGPERDVPVSTPTRLSARRHSGLADARSHLAAHRPRASRREAVRQPRRDPRARFVRVAMDNLGQSRTIPDNEKSPWPARIDISPGHESAPGLPLKVETRVQTPLGLLGSLQVRGTERRLRSDPWLRLDTPNGAFWHVDRAKIAPAQ